MRTMVLIVSVILMSFLSGCLSTDDIEVIDVDGSHIPYASFGPITESKLIELKCSLGEYIEMPEHNDLRLCVDEVRVVEDEVEVYVRFLGTDMTLICGAWVKVPDSLDLCNKNFYNGGIWLESFAGSQAVILVLDVKELGD